MKRSNKKIWNELRIALILGIVFIGLGLIYWFFNKFLWLGDIAKLVDFEN